ncbi:hypothetical protein AUF78_17605 [archaeon 13_1_20CM_2_51_12]|nr:MAG: hypothetical protein AUI97_05960 [Crenarchaeota archaeon 13_1_40CM_3_52_17]OLE68117.1 MAG: hypothetical protein AUF78_17605 [archaeon 13_1_20CM_2_51_12]
MLILFLGVTANLFVSSSSSLTRSQPHPIVAAPPNPMNTRIAVDPYAIVNLNNQLSDVVFTLNLTNSPPINGFAVVLSYNRNFLAASSLDYSGNIVSQIPNGTPLIYRYCLDGFGIGSPSYCAVDDGPGITSFAETVSGSGSSLTLNNTSGTLFTVHFAPVALGFSQMQVKLAYLSNGTRIAPPVSTFGGYYTSIDCPAGSGNPCTPSSPNFTWSPAEPAAGTIVAFYGNISTHPSGVTIRDYFWNFGDRTNQNPYQDTHTNSTAQYTYHSVGTFSVTLTISDSYNINSSITQQVTVHNANVEIGVSNIIVQPGAILLVPGVIVRITAYIQNYGANPVNDTASLILDGRLLNQTSVVNLAISSEVTITAVWNTTHFLPNAYRLDAYVPPLPNQTDTSHNRKTVWIQLILPSPGGLGLWPSSAIGVAVLGTIGYGVTRLRRRGIPLDTM